MRHVSSSTSVSNPRDTTSGENPRPDAGASRTPAAVAVSRAADLLRALAAVIEAVPDDGEPVYSLTLNGSTCRLDVTGDGWRVEMSGAAD